MAFAGPSQAGTFEVTAPASIVPIEIALRANRTYTLEKNKADRATQSKANGVRTANSESQAGNGTSTTTGNSVLGIL